jgi:hypothetical protein
LLGRADCIPRQTCHDLNPEHLSVNLPRHFQQPLIAQLGRATIKLEAEKYMVYLSSD